MNLENTMSRPDYEQTILHHSYLLVLLRGVGPSKSRTLQKAFDKVRGVNNVKITDSNGLIRDIWVRYIHDHPVENNDWGLDFSVKDLPAHLRPQRLQIDKAESGPFLFTPLQFNSIDRRDKNKDKNKIGNMFAL
uniref:Uncharacterized protein n=1 Tax=Glossina pallidipes TaxID=7398 RepID=A0A1A9ZTQ1_GLOPL